MGFSPSPDGRRIATALPAANNKLWLLDLERDILTRLTFGPGNDRDLAWSPRGDWLYFSSDRHGPPQLYRVRVEDGVEERLASSAIPQLPSGVSPDGRVLAFTQDTVEGGDLWVLPLGDGAPPRPFLQTRFQEDSAVFSPDGEWLLYRSDETGISEVYLRRFPDASGKVQVTSGADVDWQGFHWSKGGREIVYRDREGWAAVAVELGGQPKLGRPRRLFGDAIEAENLIVAGDRPGFLANVAPKRTESPDRIEIVFNWFEDVKRQTAGAGR
jgi:Tol biopolymer transport system component